MPTAFRWAGIQQEAAHSHLLHPCSGATSGASGERICRVPKWRWRVFSAVRNRKRQGYGAMEPSQWWTMYGKHVPMLASLAQQVLSQPTAASAAERNWSVYGQIHSQARSRMSHQVADKLVFAHESMHVQMRMQSAGWSPDVSSNGTMMTTVSKRMIGLVMRLRVPVRKRFKVCSLDRA
mmetsp:Transcript_53518/g.73365  ORF Transcript_53518/g.73365 Transcript_53518/m.73365 type:complete len:179 (-) Transcript_53518:128-664(-)